MTVTDYFQATDNYFWRWAEDGTVIEIPESSTIGYRSQIEEYLLQIAPQGLPPFGAFLLAMAALNSSSNTLLNVRSFIKEKRMYNYDWSQIEGYGYIEEALSFLDILSELPKEYKTGSKKGLVLQTIFANSHNLVSRKKSISLVNQFRNKSKTGNQIKPFSKYTANEDFRSISLLTRRFPNANSIIKAIKNLPDIEEDIEIFEVENSASPKTDYANFVEALIDHSKTFEIGQLIQPIWAGFNFATFNSFPSGQPLGGVSDLSNKGDFSQLLISEFANEDLAFMSRIANNEALYLQREPPPTNDEVQRIILMDITLKAWGTPKILTFAAGLAVAKHPKSKSESTIYVIGKRYMQVAHNTVEGVIDGLQLVDTNLHPDIGLAEFIKEHKDQKQLEVFYITTSEGLKYPAIQKRIAEHKTFFKYIITTDQEGEINFYRNTKASQKHLQTLRLPLKQLWKKKKQSRSVSKPKTQPLDSRKSLYPILFPRNNKNVKRFPLGDHTVYYVANRTLFRTSVEDDKKGKKGWERIVSNIPNNGKYEIGQHENGDVLFLCFEYKTKEITIWNLRTLDRVTTIFNQAKVKLEHGFLFYLNKAFILTANNPTGYTFDPDFNSKEIKIEEGTFGSKVYYDFQIRQRALEYRVPFVPKNIFRNIKRVYINANKNLVFNKHELYLHDDHDLIHFRINNQHTKLLEATATGQKNIFCFKDGSQVIIDVNGMIRLEDGNKIKSTIYITSTVSSSLAVATDKDFAGNPFYYNEQFNLRSVELKSVGTNKLEIVKAIRRHTSLRLSTVRHHIENTPTVLPQKIRFDKANLMVEKLNNLGCDAAIYKAPPSGQSIITNESFYEQHIDSFIQQQLQYETKH